MENLADFDDANASRSPAALYSMVVHWSLKKDNSGLSRTQGSSLEPYNIAAGTGVEIKNSLEKNKNKAVIDGKTIKKKIAVKTRKQAG